MANRKGFKYNVSFTIDVTGPGSWKMNEKGLLEGCSPVVIAEGYDGSRIFSGGGIGVAVPSLGGVDKEWFELQFNRRGLLRWARGKPFQMDLMLMLTTGSRLLNFGNCETAGQTKHSAMAISTGKDGELYRIRASSRSVWWLIGYQDAIVEVIKQKRSNRGKRHKLGDME